MTAPLQENPVSLSPNVAVRPLVKDDMLGRFEFFGKSEDSA